MKQVQNNNYLRDFVIFSKDNITSLRTPGNVYLQQKTTKKKKEKSCIIAKKRRGYVRPPHLLIRNYCACCNTTYQHCLLDQLFIL